MAKKVLLKDVATLLNGRAYKQDELLDSGKYPVLRVGNFFSNRGWFYSDLELEDDKYCDNGDLLFAWSASFGPKIWDGGTVIYHYHIWKILTTPQIDKKYFYYYLENAADRIKESGHGIAMIHTTKGEMEQMELLLPEMEQQLQIATILDKVSELIALRKEQIAKLDQLVKSRFIELSNEWGCEATPLQEFLDDITYGFTNPMPDAEEGPWKITAKDVVNGRINFDTARKTTLQAYEELTAKSKPDIGTVLLTKDGTLGRCAVVEEDGICVNQSVAVLKCNKKILPKFLAILLQMPEYQREMLKNAGGGTIKHIYITKVVDMMVMVPDVSQQLKFLTFVEQTGLEEYLSVGNRDNVRGYVCGNIAAQSFNNGQGGKAAAAGFFSKVSRTLKQS